MNPPVTWIPFSKRYARQTVYRHVMKRKLFKMTLPKTSSKTFFLFTDNAVKVISGIGPQKPLANGRTF